MRGLKINAPEVDWNATTAAEDRANMRNFVRHHRNALATNKPGFWARVVEYIRVMYF